MDAGRGSKVLASEQSYGYGTEGRNSQRKKGAHYSQVSEVTASPLPHELPGREAGQKEGNLGENDQDDGTNE